MDDGSRLRSYSESTEVNAAELLAGAPDLTVGRNQVGLVDGRYLISLDLPPVRGEIALEAGRGRSQPPLTIRGARGWMSGLYRAGDVGGVVGSTQRRWDGTLARRRVRLPRPQLGALDRCVLAMGAGPWGRHLSFVYGRVHPPADAADPGRVPGFLVVIGADGPIGYTTRLSIEEDDDPETGAPRRVVVESRGYSVALRLEVDVEDVAMNRMDREGFGTELDFYQLRARFHVVGRVGDRTIDFTAPGSAETFRGR